MHLIGAPRDRKSSLEIIPLPTTSQFALCQESVFSLMVIFLKAMNSSRFFIILILLGANMWSSRGNQWQRKGTPVPRQPPFVWPGGGLDPRKTAGRDFGEARKMQVIKEKSSGRSLCQDSQHRGVFLQIALSACVYLFEYRLLALLWRNFRVRVRHQPAAE